MRNRHIIIEGGQDAPDATSGIAPSAATGADRVRELEHLLETARKVRAHADAEGDDDGNGQAAQGAPAAARGCGSGRTLAVMAGAAA